MRLGQVYARLARTVGLRRGATLVRSERVRLMDALGRTVQVAGPALSLSLSLSLPLSPLPLSAFSHNMSGSVE